jgi:phosphoribosyl 1,2-cyclic phosphate phosphodiesterase
MRHGQMLSKVEAILFTHEHDHNSGLDDIRPFNFKQGEMPIYAHQKIDNLKERLFMYLRTGE